MRFQVACLTLLFITPPTARSQATHTISPRGHGQVPGNASSYFPWGGAVGGYRSVRYLEIHDDLAGAARVLVGLAMRRSGANSRFYPALSASLQVEVSTAALASQSASSVFASNHGFNRVTAISLRTVNFPAVGPPANGIPAAFTYVLPFDQPFAHSGAAGACFEVMVTGNNSTSLYDQDLDCARSGQARNDPFGAGCGGVFLTGQWSAPMLQQSVTGLAPGLPVVLMVGSQNEQFGGVALPLDLAPAGAPGCSLRVGPLLFLTAVAGPGGDASFLLDTTGVGPTAVVQLQAAAVMPSANALGLLFSNGSYATGQMPATFARVWATNYQALSGQPQRQNGLVVDFLQP